MDGRINEQTNESPPEFYKALSPLGPLPKRAGFRPERVNFRRERADFRPERADFRPERADSRPERADFRPKRVDFRPERAWGDERTNGRNDRMNSHKSVRWSAVPMPCLSRLCSKLTGVQGSGSRVVINLCY